MKQWFLDIEKQAAKRVIYEGRETNEVSLTALASCLDELSGPWHKEGTRAQDKDATVVRKSKDLKKNMNTIRNGTESIKMNQMQFIEIFKDLI